MPFKSGKKCWKSVLPSKRLLYLWGLGMPDGVRTILQLAAHTILPLEETKKVVLQAVPKV